MTEHACIASPALLNELASESILASPPALLNHLPLGCYACDASGRLCWFNEQAAEFWGRRPLIGDESERFCGSYKLYSLDGSTICREQTPMAHVLRTGEPVSGATASVERLDGAIFIAMVHIKPIKDRAGHVIGAINCFHDITEDKEAERRHRLSEQYLRDLLNALPTAIYTTDADGRVTFFNEAAIALTGRRPQIGSDQWCVSWELYTPEGTPLPREASPAAIALRENRAVPGVEAVLKRPDGNFVPFVSYPTPLHNASGQLVGAVNILVDISQRKQHETTQQLLFSELNHRVKNNLQMLQGLFKTAVRESDNQGATSILKEAVQKVAAISAAQRVLYRADLTSEVEAKDFLHSVCSCLQDVLPGGVAMDFAADDFPISNDAITPLALIINELVTNSSKHAANDAGQVRIYIRLLTTGTHYSLHVWDSGPGVVTANSTKRASGHGLIRGLATQIGGTVEVKPNSGARCIVSVPHPSAR